jgi:hypothetical protein
MIQCLHLFHIGAVMPEPRRCSRGLDGCVFHGVPRGRNEWHARYGDTEDDGDSPVSSGHTGGNGNDSAVINK